MRRLPAPAAALALFVAGALLPVRLAADDTVVLEGRVRGPAGSPPAETRLIADVAGTSRAVPMSPDGRFALSVRAGETVRLRVEAPGFRSEERMVRARAGVAPVLVLAPAVYSEEVAVTASRRPERLADSAASVVVLSGEDLPLSGWPIDLLLKEVPGFTLFRRLDSRYANPTTQSPSLRGVGGSGAPRAAVLDDGVPINDPFGGWVAWGRVPRAALERAEVLLGGGSDLYGGDAAAGAISIVRPSGPRPGLAADASYGGLATRDASWLVALGSGGWNARLAGESFATDGYVAVAPAERGAVDTPTASRHDTADLTIEHDAAAGGRAFFRGSYYDESRENGTPLTTNDTRFGQAALGGDWPVASGALSARLSGFWEEYHQTFSAVSDDRSTESLTSLQTVPSRAFRGSVQWTGGSARQKLLAGVEGEGVSGKSEDESATTEVVTTRGGHQTIAAVFARDEIALSDRWTATLGARFDRWANAGEVRGSAAPDAPAPPSDLPGRSASFFSPRVSLFFRASDAVALTASAYRGFRAPTLNELYRPFRAGNTITLANPDLSPERLSGVETGVLATAWQGRLSARATLFWMEVSDPIVNVTLATTPSLITRERKNLGRTRSRGVEVDAEAALPDGFTLGAGYLFADATVLEAASPSLVGLRVPQVPRHQGSVRLVWRGGPAHATAMMRLSSAQFDDDRNTLRLAPYATIDLLAGYAITRALEVFAAGENLTGERVEVARTPVLTLGPPRTFRGGLRLAFDFL